MPPCPHSPRSISLSLTLASLLSTGQQENNGGHWEWLQKISFQLNRSVQNDTSLGCPDSSFGAASRENKQHLPWVICEGIQGCIQKPAAGSQSRVRRVSSPSWQTSTTCVLLMASTCNWAVCGFCLLPLKMAEEWMLPLCVVCCLKWVAFKAMLLACSSLLWRDGAGGCQCCFGTNGFVSQSVVIERVRARPKATLNRLC